MITYKLRYLQVRNQQARRKSKLNVLMRAKQQLWKKSQELV